MSNSLEEQTLDALLDIAEQLVNTRGLFAAEWISAAQIVAAAGSTPTPLTAARALLAANFHGGLTAADLDTICAMAFELGRVRA